MFLLLVPPHAPSGIGLSTQPRPPTPPCGVARFVSSTFTPPHQPSGIVLFAAATADATGRFGSSCFLYVWPSPCAFGDGAVCRHYRRRHRAGWLVCFFSARVGYVSLLYTSSLILPTAVCPSPCALGGFCCPLPLPPTPPCGVALLFSFTFAPSHAPFGEGASAAAAADATVRSSSFDSFRRALVMFHSRARQVWFSAVCCLPLPMSPWGSCCPLPLPPTPPCGVARFIPVTSAATADATVWCGSFYSLLRCPPHAPSGVVPSAATTAEATVYRIPALFAPPGDPRAAVFSSPLPANAISSWWVWPASVRATVLV